MKDSASWNGDLLVGWVSINGLPTQVTADRDTIHRHAAGYSDAISWELERFSDDIFEKLNAYFVSSIPSLSEGSGPENSRGHI
jgi:hypothetical protein